MASFSNMVFDIDLNECLTAHGLDCKQWNKNSSDEENSDADNWLEKLKPPPRDFSNFIIDHTGIKWHKTETDPQKYLTELNRPAKRYNATTEEFKYVEQKTFSLMDCVVTKKRQPKKKKKSNRAISDDPDQRRHSFMRGNETEFVRDKTDDSIFNNNNVFTQPDKIHIELQEIYDKKHESTEIKKDLNKQHKEGENSIFDKQLFTRRDININIKSEPEKCLVEPTLLDQTTRIDTKKTQMNEDYKQSNVDLMNNKVHNSEPLSTECSNECTDSAPQKYYDTTVTTKLFNNNKCDLRNGIESTSPNKCEKKCSNNPAESQKPPEMNFEQNFMKLLVINDVFDKHLENNAQPIISNDEQQNNLYESDQCELSDNKTESNLLKNSTITNLDQGDKLAPSRKKFNITFLTSGKIRKKRKSAVRQRFSGGSFYSFQKAGKNRKPKKYVSRGSKFINLNLTKLATKSHKKDEVDESPMTKKGITSFLFSLVTLFFMMFVTHALFFVLF